ncbi:MAG: hypothetical protein AAGJ35_15640, partial [Myxococcota bacterium]
IFDQKPQMLRFKARKPRNRNDGASSKLHLKKSKLALRKKQNATDLKLAGVQDKLHAAHEKLHGESYRLHVAHNKFHGESYRLHVAHNKLHDPQHKLHEQQVKLHDTKTSSTWSSGSFTTKKQASRISRPVSVYTEQA